MYEYYSTDTTIITGIGAQVLILWNLTFYKSIKSAKGKFLILLFLI